MSDPLSPTCIYPVPRLTSPQEWDDFVEQHNEVSVKCLVPITSTHCETVWVLIVSGDQHNGFGILNKQTGNTDIPHGSFVRYRQLDSIFIPVITSFGYSPWTSRQCE